MGTEATGLPKLSAPARRALIGAGYSRLEHLTKAKESDILELHGMGPSAMRRRVPGEAPSSATPPSTTP